MAPTHRQRASHAREASRQQGKWCYWPWLKLVLVDFCRNSMQSWTESLCTEEHHSELDLFDGCRIEVFSFHIRCDCLPNCKIVDKGRKGIQSLETRVKYKRTRRYWTWIKTIEDIWTPDLDWVARLLNVSPALCLNDFVGNVVLVEVEQTIQECFGILQHLLGKARSSTLKAWDRT